MSAGQRLRIVIVMITMTIITSMDVPPGYRKDGDEHHPVF